MTSPPLPTPAPEALTYCQRHPTVESVLRCGRCDAFICPRCLVFTPAGTRCPDCAQLRRPPMYELSATHYLRATGAALVMAVVFGVAGAFLVPVAAGGFFMLTLAVLGGSALGGLVAEVLQRATGYKRGPVMQAAAVSTLVLADVIRLVLAGGLPFVAADLPAALLIAIASVVAWGRLR